MKILITGASGFIGRNLVEGLKNKGYNDLYLYDQDTNPDQLNVFCRDCEFVYHLAGVNRPENISEFQKGNVELTALLLNCLEEHQNNCPVMLSSSIQAKQDNPYGRSKKMGEEALIYHQKKTGADIWIYQFSNVFGKWCRPNYNSVVATFCDKIAHQQPIQINDPKAILELVYIDDVVEELLHAMEGHPHLENGLCSVPITHSVTVGTLAELLYGYYESRETHQVADMTEGSLSKKLYSTYLSYLPEGEFKRPLSMNCDARGSFTEILRTEDRGQFSVNIIKPGVTKGNHYHNTKNEKFLVVSGDGLIRFRQIGSDRILEYPVSGQILELVDIPVGYTHSITNQGDTDMITFMWCNERFNPEKPDTYFQEVGGRI